MRSFTSNSAIGAEHNSERQQFPSMLAGTADMTGQVWDNVENSQRSVMNEVERLTPKTANGNSHQPLPHLESAPASSFKMRAVRWLWLNRFAIGKIGLIAGLPDRGKGLITADITARVTTEGEWPCGEGRAPKGRVLVLSAEDDIEDTILPRLAAAGANLELVEIIRMVREGDGKRMFSFVSDLQLLRQKLEQFGDVAMVLVDPLTAYLGVGKINSYRSTDVRAVLSPLKELAEEKRVCIISVMHFNKKNDVTNALLRVAESLAFGAIARHCFAVIDDLENERRLFVKAKNNVAPDNKALTFGINAVAVGQDEGGEPIWAPRVVWGLEHVDVTATQAMEAESAGKSAAGPRAEAKTFLLNMLVNGPVDKKEIEAAADANCISIPTLRRAKTELKIEAKKTGMNGGWRWHLPEQQPVSSRLDED